MFLFQHPRFKISSNEAPLKSVLAVDADLGEWALKVTTFPQKIFWPTWNSKRH